MTGRRAMIGLCMLCALAFSAIAASAASAETHGWTAFTCKSTAEGGAGFSKEHCKPGDAVGSGAKFKHVAFAEETTTSITGGNVPTEGEGREVQFMKSTQSGVTEELQAKIVEKDPETSAWMKNRKDPATGEHYIEGEGNLTYTEVTQTLPAGQGCKVFGKRTEPKPGEIVHSTEGSVTTERLTATTKGVKSGWIRFSPPAGKPFATFYLTNCKTAVFNGPYEVTGSIEGKFEGATIVTKETGAAGEGSTTEQNTLKLRGQKAGLEGSLTIRGYDEAQGQKPEEDIALSATEVPTP